MNKTNPEHRAEQAENGLLAMAKRNSELRDEIYRLNKEIDRFKNENHKLTVDLSDLRARMHLIQLRVDSLMEITGKVPEKTG